MVKTLSCGLRDPGSIPGRGNFFSHTHISLLFSAKTSCLQSPIRRRHPHLSYLPCPLPMVRTSRSHRGLALRTHLCDLLGMSRRVYHPRRPHSVPHLPRREHTRCPRYDATSYKSTRVHTISERTPIMLYYKYRIKS